MRIKTTAEAEKQEGRQTAVRAAAPEGRQTEERAAAPEGRRTEERAAAPEERRKEERAMPPEKRRTEERAAAPEERRTEERAEMQQERTTAAERARKRELLFHLNDSPLRVPQKEDGQPYYLMDMLQYSGIDLKNPKGTVKLTVNGLPGRFQQVLKEGDRISILEEQA